MKSIKLKKVTTESFSEAVNIEELQELDLSKVKSAKKTEFHFKNIIPIPQLLTKTFLGLTKFDPISVAHAFYLAMLEHDLNSKESTETTTGVEDQTLKPAHSKDQDDNSSKASKDPKSNIPKLAEEDPLEMNKSLSKTDDETKEDSQIIESSVLVSKFLSLFSHILQFCHLCAKKKMPPVHYSMVCSPTVDKWFERLGASTTPVRLQKIPKRPNPALLDTPDSADSSDSPDHKMSRKDQYFIHTMLKIHDTMDKSYKEKSDKEPGFARLEAHRKNLILNASAKSPYKNQAKQATEFYATFLAKKSQFKAKDMLVHQLQMEKVAFNPSSSFANNLWNCEFFWLLPDSLSGVSIFFCPETISANAADIEKERMLALADKVNTSDIEKLAKQKMYLPNSVMDLVWMTQNFYAVIKLCFGPASHSASFLKDWADHMYKNGLMYTTMHSSDPYFFAKVLYTIDNALQKHWRSCSTSNDRLSVNNRVLYMQEVQDSILDFSFSRNIPKVITEKIDNYLINKDKDNNNNEKNGGGAGQGNGKYKFKGDGKNGNGKQEVMHNNDKNHPN